MKPYNTTFWRWQYNHAEHDLYFHFLTTLHKLTRTEWLCQQRETILNWTLWTSVRSLRKSQHNSASHAPFILSLQRKPTKKSITYSKALRYGVRFCSPHRQKRTRFLARARSQGAPLSSDQGKWSRSLWEPINEHIHSCVTFSPLTFWPLSLTLITTLREAFERAILASWIY